MNGPYAQVVFSAGISFAQLFTHWIWCRARYHTLFRLNPLAYPLNGFRLAIYYGLLPSPQSMAMSLGTGLVTLLLGYYLFVRYQDTLVFYV